MSPSTNSGTPSLEDTMDRLKLAHTAEGEIPTPSPLSIAEHQDHHAPLSITSKPPHQTFHRTPSSTSITKSERTVTPVLHKRASYTSLQGISGSATPPRSPAVRRVSSNTSLDQPAMAPRSSLPAPIEEPERSPVTAASVAKAYFMRELDVHREGSGADQSHNTVVILQDDCYGHRYSRPRTSRASLGTIVERPERIHASILGLATAYVRLGGRHADGHSAPHPKRKAGLLAAMPFRIHKTNRRVSLLSQAAASVHGAQWMNELKTMCEAAESRLAMNGKELTRPPSAGQTMEKPSSEKSKLHEGDLYLCSASLEALEGALGGVCEAVDAVFRDGGPRRAFVCIRPPGHHCSAGMPSGFCWVNNVHIGIDYAAKTHDLTHAAIIDFDLHHGDGSQSIAWAHNAKIASMPKNTPQAKRTAIGYFSVHDINSYPCEGGDEDKVRNASLCLENAHGQTIWNVHLQPWKTDKEFWDLYQNRYTAILTKARSFLRFHTERLKQAPLHPRPRAAIFLSAGFDASEWESPGMQRHQVNVPTDFYARFTRDVVAIADEEGLGVDGRVISVLEGGYSDRALMSGVLSHLSGLTAAEIPRSRPTTSNGLAQEMSQRLGKLEINGHARHGSGNLQQYQNEALDPEWWSLPSLEEIERTVNPPAPPAGLKKNRTAAPTTYSSATQSYTAKIVSPPQNRRSLSGTGPTYMSSVTSSPRAPSPPPPPVEWAIAAHELSKLLIPSDRQTWSCKPEDLNAEATRARRDRQSNIGLPVEVPANEGKRMQLRDRRAKPPKYASDEESEKPMSRAGRRRTIADVATIVQTADDLPPMPAAANPGEAVRPKARRSSMASSVSSVNGERPLLDFAPVATALPTQSTIVVKKNRAPGSSRPEPARKRAVKPDRSVPPVLECSAPPKPAQDVIPERLPSEPLAESGDLKNRDVDQIASGMKKMNIKLNVASKEEQKVREAKRGPTALRGKAKANATKTSQAVGAVQKPMKSPSTIAKDLTATASTEGKTPFQNLLSPSEPSKGGSIDLIPQGMASQPSPKNLPDLTHDEAAPSSHFPDSAPPSFLPASAPAIPATAPSIMPSNLLPPYPPRTQTSPIPPATPQPPTRPSELPLPPSSPPPAPTPPAAPRRQASENLISPITPKHSRHNLPVFSSTSSIPFGGPPPTSNINQTLDSPSQFESNQSVGQKSTLVGSAAAAPADQAAFSKLERPPQPIGGGGGGGRGSMDVQKTQDKDIFEVPDSPLRPGGTGGRA
ncbi:MAG: hypothetical protein L6R35_000763 [Caloplaca aegaea]|nr:MAG: hypothetical protein L6R35_000763 [Caloplaca aegaea]